MHKLQTIALMNKSIHIRIWRLWGHLVKRADNSIAGLLGPPCKLVQPSAPIYPTVKCCTAHLRIWISWCNTTLYMRGLEGMVFNSTVIILPRLLQCNIRHGMSNDYNILHYRLAFRVMVEVSVTSPKRGTLWKLLGFYH